MYSIPSSQVGELLSNAERLLGLQPTLGLKWLCNNTRTNFNSCTNSQVSQLQCCNIYNEQCLFLICSCNGNFLLNVGPNHDGRIMPIFEERLLDIGMTQHTHHTAVEVQFYMNSMMKC